MKVNFLDLKSQYLSIKPEIDRAIEVEKSAIDKRNPSIANVNVWLEFEPLRADPRFQDLLRWMNLEP